MTKQEEKKVEQLFIELLKTIDEIVEITGTDDIPEIRKAINQHLDKLEEDEEGDEPEKENRRFNANDFDNSLLARISSKETLKELRDCGLI